MKNAITKRLITNCRDRGMEDCLKTSEETDSTKMQAKSGDLEFRQCDRERERERERGCMNGDSTCIVKHSVHKKPIPSHTKFFFLSEQRVMRTHLNIP